MTMLPTPPPGISHRHVTVLPDGRIRNPTQDLFKAGQTIGFALRYTTRWTGEHRATVIEETDHLAVAVEGSIIALDSPAISIGTIYPAEETP